MLESLDIRVYVQESSVVVIVDEVSEGVDILSIFSQLSSRVLHINKVSDSVTVLRVNYFSEGVVSIREPVENTEPKRIVKHAYDISS